MTIRIPLVPAIVIVLAAGCSSAPPAPSAKGASAAAPKAAPAATKPTAESRADELIADLQRRESEQAKINQDARDNVRVVTEVSPKSSSGMRTPGAAQSSAYATGAPSAGGASEAEANRWKQEFSMAQARLQSSQQKLEEAQRRMNDAQSQMNNTNSAVRKMGQDAYNRAQQEVSSAQSAVNNDRYAVDSARSQALAAGVPASYLR